jgi:hypothetical protein
VVECDLTFSFEIGIIVIHSQIYCNQLCYNYFMKQHIILPLVLVVAAVVVGISMIAIGVGNSNSLADNGEAEIAVVSVSADLSAAAANSGVRVVNWETANLPSRAKVTINLLKKISTNPNQYQFVRTLAANTANDGTESWTPLQGESGDAYYVEVVCSNASMNGGCKATAEPVRAF